MSKLNGCDISMHQALTFDYKSNDFVIIKATEGRTYTDPRFLAHYENAKKAGVLIGFYHFARPDNNKDPLQEVNNFLNAVGDKLTNDTLVALDLEAHFVTDANVIWARKWLDGLYEKTGRRALLYTSGSCTKKLQTIYDGNYGLWVAHYGVKKPTIGVYTFYAIWQYTSTPHDKNYFAGTVETWKKYCAVDKVSTGGTVGVVGCECVTCKALRGLGWSFNG